MTKKNIKFHSDANNDIHATYPDDTIITVTDPTTLMRKGLEDASTKIGTFHQPTKPATVGFVLDECSDVKDELCRLNGDVNQRVRDIDLTTGENLRLHKVEIKKRLDAYENAMNLKYEDRTQERQVAILMGKYDHVITILDRIMLGGFVMFGVSLFTVLFVHYIQP